MWRPLGRHLGALGRHLGSSWGSWAPSWLIFGLLVAILLPKKPQHSSNMSQDSPNSNQHRPKRPLRNPRDLNFSMNFDLQSVIAEVFFLLTNTRHPYGDLFCAPGPNVNLERSRTQISTRLATLTKQRDRIAAIGPASPNIQLRFSVIEEGSKRRPKSQRNSQNLKFSHFGTYGFESQGAGGRGAALQ